MGSAYAKGRKYEYQWVKKVEKHKSLRAKRVLLSGQRGEGDVIITKPLSETDGIVLASEVKARKSVPKVVYDWLGEHDLLVMKKIGQQYGWLVTLDADLFLEILAQLSHNLGNVSDKPKNVHAEDDDSYIL